MTSNDTDIDALFEQLLGQAPESRRRWLSERCSDDVQSELLSLLDAHEQAGGFLQESIQLSDSSTLEQGLIGRQLGAYQIDGLIAYGGMGRIYSAYRNDGEYEQQVAVKLIEAAEIDPALLKYERQILADLRHPNIVSLIDGGSLQEGVPYLVMESIEGLAIDQYATEKALTHRQIIILFSSLVKVVSHTHQHGVIHCDLKPGNILVTPEGELKLLDFGVAHLCSIATSDRSFLTCATTPEYASPQRLVDPLPRIADDIYSLGVIFGVLLSGRAPRVNCNIEEKFSVDLSGIEQSLPKELRSIFLKATAFNPQARYQTAAEIGDDLFRWLDNKPLSTMSGQPAYRLRKFLTRHSGRFVGGLVVFVLVLVMFFFWEQQEYKTKQTESVVVAQTDKILREFDNRMERLSGSTLYRASIAEEILVRLKDIDLNEVNNFKIKKAVADAYKKLGDVLGNPFLLHLGQFERSRRHLEKSIALYEEILSDTPKKPRVVMAYAYARRTLAMFVVFIDHQPEKALKFLQEDLDLLLSIKRKKAHQNNIAYQYFAIAYLLMKFGKYDDAAKYFESGAAFMEKADDSDNEIVRKKKENIYHYFEDHMAGFALVNPNVA